MLRRGDVRAWRYYLLKGYTLGVGAALLIFGLLETFIDPFHPEHAESVLHIGVGALFIAGGGVLDNFTYLRSFVGGMGALLIIGKVVIVTVRSIGLDPFFLPSVGYVCAVIGVCSLLLALFIGKAHGQ